MTQEVKGLVVRTTEVNDNDRLITIFSDKLGAVTAMARGARSYKSRKFAATMQFCYASFVLDFRQDKCYVKEASLIESFFDIRKNVESLALSAYVAEVISNVVVAEADHDLLRLSLNTLYAISKGLYSLDKIKAAFEVRAMSILGFMPSVHSCDICGERGGEFFFDIMSGVVNCKSCQRKKEGIPEEEDSHIRRVICILPEGSKTAMEYCIFCPLEKLFSFNLSEEEARLFYRAAEEYLVNHLERGFKTLDFYKEVKL